jgi:hypothetical protein
VKTKLEKLVVTVEEFLESIDSRVPFFVAGGSVYSIINGSTQYDDIDVFFYNREECESVISKLDTSEHQVQIISDDAPVISTKPSAYITSNAVTVPSLLKSMLQRQIQFVKLYVGDVHEVLSTFDLNCSKLAFTSDRQFVQSDDYTQHITVDEKNINGAILNRYYKYKSKKGCDDIDAVTLKQIVRFLVDNFERQFDTGYKGEPNIAGHTLLDNAISNVTTYSMPVAQYAHDYVMTKDVKTRLAIFSKSSPFMNAKIENIGDELYLFLMLRAVQHPKVYACVMKDDIKLKYAEYFI